MIVEISICGPDADAGALATFFSANLTPEYISHSELQSGRTTAAGAWVPNITAVLEDEIRLAIAQDAGQRHVALSWNGVFAAHLDGRIVGIAIVQYARDAALAYGVLEDLVVDAKLRGQQIGTRLIELVLADMRASGVKRAFLESGINNHGPHALFHKIGFQDASVVMVKDLP
jgi:GNAT superfamily N-acetyltransferase